MGDLDISIDLIDSEIEITDKILKALKPQVSKYFQRTLDRCKQKLVSVVQKAIVDSPEYSSLLSGKLKAEFGLPDSDSRLNTILDFWKNITFSYEEPFIRNNQIGGKFVLNMIRSDYSDVLGSSAASLVTEKGANLNWLEWLLLFGDKKIIKDYEVKMGPNPNSRTGMAIMKGVLAGKWGVPPEFSGVRNDNWITRAIDSVEDEIELTLYNNLKK